MVGTKHDYGLDSPFISHVFFLLYQTQRSTTALFVSINVKTERESDYTH